MKTIKYFALMLMLAASMASISSCVVRQAGWIPGHYNYGPNGGRVWVPGHYAR